MNRPFWLGLVMLSVLSASLLWACQSRPAVPTAAPEPTEAVIVVVVTATSQPTLPPTNTTEPTITPLPTPVITATATITPAAATATLPATRVPTIVPTVAEQPTVEPTAGAAATEQPTVPAATFPAPQPLAPEGKTFRDGDTLEFVFTSVGGLPADHCYRVDMSLSNPQGAESVSDWWVGLCGEPSGEGHRLKFLVKPARFRSEANYGTLLALAESAIPPAPTFGMQWTVSVVKIVDNTDPIHPTVVAVSPASPALQNSFFR